MSDNLLVSERIQLADGVGVFESPVRKLFDWKARPLSRRFSRMEDEVRGFASDIDFILAKIVTLPSMQGMLKSYPDFTKLRFSFAASTDDQMAGDYCRNRITLYYDCKRAAHIGCNFRTVPHEIRHGWHDRRHILMERQFLPLEHMALKRAYEVDSRIFAMTVAAELQALTGDGTAMFDVTKCAYHAQIAKAFFSLCLDDPASLWDGRAQAMAYRAYFEKIIAGLLFITITGPWKMLLRILMVTSCKRDLADMILGVSSGVFYLCLL